MENNPNQTENEKSTDKSVTHHKTTATNYWMLASIVFCALFLGTLGLYLGSLQTNEKRPNPDTPSIKPSSPVNNTRQVSRFTGSVKTGAQKENKNYCPNGLYLVAQEGTYLTGQTTSLLLRVPVKPDGTKMVSDQKYVDKKVEVVGTYPAQEYFCEAFMCDCEDYILVDTVRILEPQIDDSSPVEFEGELVCLPHKDNGGPETFECAIGLQGNNGLYYGLSGLNQEDLISGKLITGQTVVITGTLSPSEKSLYKIQGTIHVLQVLKTP